jgi:hypothetical protein
MRDLDEILAKIEGQKNEIKKFGVKRLGVFGSFSRGEQTSDSDIDFLVEFEKDTFDAYMGLCFFLEDLLGIDVDLVVSRAVKSRIRPTIMEEVVYVPGL